jgi:hypothetical protein
MAAVLAWLMAGVVALGLAFLVCGAIIKGVSRLFQSGAGFALVGIAIVAYLTWCIKG